MQAYLPSNPVIPVGTMEKYVGKSNVHYLDDRYDPYTNGTCPATERC